MYVLLSSEHGSRHDCLTCLFSSGHTCIDFRQSNNGGTSFRELTSASNPTREWKWSVLKLNVHTEVWTQIDSTELRVLVQSVAKELPSGFQVWSSLSAWWWIDYCSPGARYHNYGWLIVILGDCLYVNLSVLFVFAVVGAAPRMMCDMLTWSLPRTPHYLYDGHSRSKYCPNVCAFGKDWYCVKEWHKQKFWNIHMIY